MYITKLQALKMAISTLESQPQTDEINQAILRLKNMMKDTKMIPWTKEAVFKRLNEWKKEHGRNPTVTNLAEPGMPKAVTIQHLFDMKASAFFNIYYPLETKRTSTTPYSVKSKDEWLAFFCKQYDKIKPTSGTDYNAKREEGTPTWITIARYCGVSQWTKLLEISNVDTSHLKRVKQPTEIILHSHCTLLDRFEMLLDRRDKQLQELMKYI